MPGAMVRHRCRHGRTGQEERPAIGAGHSFIVFLGDGSPGERAEHAENGAGGVPHLLRHSQPDRGVIAETEQGRGILGVVDGLSPKGVEDDAEIEWRKGLLRQIGYKL